MTTVINVQNLSKQYEIGVRSRYGDSVREAFAEFVRRPVQLARRNGTGARETFWALKNVDFSVDQGEVLGIIGPNGAGKSTLLKILSRITEPTSGRVELFGRVGSLLEVGTGFHADLTGRENIFLNGSILGMSRREIIRDFDEIVEFAEIDKFIDTPVKRYSSGMYVRLAFAVAAHLKPEILIVDEVLAVGDIKFQQKCLGKMGSIAGEGRTILFVSHNMAAVKTLCDRAIYLSAGEIVATGPTAEVTLKYEASRESGVSELHWPAAEAPGSDKVKLLSIRLRKEIAGPPGIYTRSEAVVGELRFAVTAESVRLNPHVHVFNRLDQLLFITSNLHDPGRGSFSYPRGEYTAVFRIPEKLLNTGVHYLSIYLISDLNYQDVHVDKAISFEVVEDGTDRGDYAGGWAGLVRPALDWTIHP